MRIKLFTLLFSVLFTVVVKAQVPSSDPVPVDTLSIKNPTDDTSKKRLPILPLLGSTPETGILFGVSTLKVFGKKDANGNFIRPSTFAPRVAFTFKKQFIFHSDLEIYQQSGLGINNKTEFLYFPNLFYGTGNNTEEEDEERYSAIVAWTKGFFIKQLHEASFFAGISYDFRVDNITEVEEDGALNNDEVIGDEGGFLWGIGPTLKFDTRDNVIYPENGWLVSLNGIVYPDALANDYHFSRMDLDARRYLSVGDKNVFAFQSFVSFSTESEIPFYKLNNLGADVRLRGINANRYIDRHVFYFQTEYRRDVYKRFGMVFFSGFGEVANQVNQFKPNGLKYIGGAGLRYQFTKDSKINVRIDFSAASDGQTGIYAGIRESF